MSGPRRMHVNAVRPVTLPPNAAERGVRRRNAELTAACDWHLRAGRMAGELALDLERVTAEFWLRKSMRPAP